MVSLRASNEGQAQTLKPGQEIMSGRVCSRLKAMSLRAGLRGCVGVRTMGARGLDCLVALRAQLHEGLGFRRRGGAHRG